MRLNSCDILDGTYQEKHIHTTVKGKQKILEMLNFSFWSVGPTLVLIFVSVSGGASSCCNRKFL
jgi:hypothetical protein